jgi:alpha-tubulin suppressor-like RCC1 family protein
MATSKGGYVDGGSDLLKAPDAPTITSVTTSIGTMSVAFTAPANPGGSAVTGYTVTAIDESTGASVGATGSASPISVSTGGGGTFKVRAAAANVYGPGRVSAFDTGNVVFSGAELYVWGNNEDGELGINSIISRSSPVQVGSETDWLQVQAGRDHSLAVKTNNTLWAWGKNGDGQVGDSTAINRSSPVQIGALTNWAQVSSKNNADHSAAVKTDGTLWTWGGGRYGELGINASGFPSGNRSSPVQVGSLTNWSFVSVGRELSAAITSTGALYAWGNGSVGALGTGGVISRSSPVQVGALTNWASVAIATRGTAAVKTDGTLWAWGLNSDGLCGLGDVVPRSSPVQVGALTNWASVDLFESCGAVKTDGTLWTWGDNSSGTLGHSNTINRSSPVQVGGLTDWKQVSAGDQWFASVKTNGTLWTWGGNSNGRLGTNTPGPSATSSPVQVGALTSWSVVCAGSSHAAATILVP